MNYSAPATLGSITFNVGSGDDYLLDPSQCSGLDQAPIRAPVDDKPGAAGGIVFDFLHGPRRVTLGGWLVNRTGTVAARQTMEDNLISALDGMLASDGTFTITPVGHSAMVLTVRCEIPVVFSGSFQKTFLFGLIAANPAFT